jgi:hypothetical protein
MEKITISAKELSEAVVAGTIGNPKSQANLLVGVAIANAMAETGEVYSPEVTIHPDGCIDMEWDNISVEEEDLEGNLIEDSWNKQVTIENEKEIRVVLNKYTLGEQEIENADSLDEALRLLEISK